MSFHLTGHVASLGFRNLSTLYSSRNLPGLFHPGPTLGGFPSRLSSSQSAVRPLRRRDPHAIGHGANAISPLQGFAHLGNTVLESWGLARVPGRLPPWVSSPLRFLAFHSRCTPIIVHPCPSRAFPARSQATSPPAPQGTSRSRRSRSFSRPA